MKIETLKELSKLSDRILDIADKFDELTTSDLQGIIGAVLLDAFNLERIKKPKPTPTAGAGNKKKFNYVDEQFKKIVPYDSGYKATIKIMTTAGHTNNMDITVPQLNKIKLILAGG